MKRIKCKIVGETALLMNRYSVQAQIQQKAGGRAITKTYDTDVEAENSAYWTSKGKKELMIPANVLYSAILNASSFHKIGKRSAKSILAGSIRIEPAEISLGTDKYEVDIRGVVIQRNRVPKARARIDTWSAEFEIVYNEKLIGEPQIIKTILEQAGERVGIMDFRPQKSGWFGLFKVTEFKEIK